MCDRALSVLWPYLGLKIDPHRDCMGNWLTISDSSSVLLQGQTKNLSAPLPSAQRCCIFETLRNQSSICLWDSKGELVFINLMEMTLNYSTGTRDRVVIRIQFVHCDLSLCRYPRVVDPLNDKVAYKVNTLNLV